MSTFFHFYEDIMIDIRQSDKTVIDDELYNMIHQYAALDFEVRKFNGKPCERGSPLERIRLEHKNLSDIFQDKLTIHPIQLTGNPFEINYKVTYQGKDYLLDREVIEAKIHLL